MANETEPVELDDPATIGRRVRRIRRARAKSLEVVAGLAEISTSQLSRLETGERSLDRLSVIVKLANALEVAPSDLVALPVPAPGNGGMDSAIAAVGRAVMAVSHDLPGGQVFPVEALRERVTAALELRYRPDRGVREVGAVLPGLIRDMHTSIGAGRDVAELLDLALVLHAQVTEAWLRIAGAPLELRDHAAVLGRRIAERRDTPTAISLSLRTEVDVALGTCDFDLAQAEMNRVSVPTTSPELTQLAGEIALRRSFVAMTTSRPAEADAALTYAAELAQRTGEAHVSWQVFGPVDVGLWRMAAAREAGDPERAAVIAAGLHPGAQPNVVLRAHYWEQYARSLVRLRGRREDAARALRRAETILPHVVQRNPAARETLAELLAHTKRDDAMGRELRGMAFRAGLPV